MDDGWLLLTVLILLDAALWIIGIVFCQGRTNRFRVHSGAVIVSGLILALLFGWQYAAILTFAGLWIAAVVATGSGWSFAGQGDAS